MYIRILLLIIALSLSPVTILYAQNFKKQQKQQRAAIEAAYRKKRVTQREYYKLIAEQESIVYAIQKAEADGYMDSREKNSIYGKIQRAEKRLRKYKTNREIY
ncbi:MAG: hypothetical protein QM594_02910 [Niabella sp.]